MVFLHFPFIFLLLLIYLQKPFLLSFTSLARCNIRQALAFLIFTLHSWIVSLYSSWAAYPLGFLSYASLCLSFDKSSLFICLAILPLLLDVLLTRADHSWTWRKRSLKTNQLFCCLQVPEQTRVCSPQVQGCCPAICFIPSSYHPEFHHLMVIAAMTAPAFTFLAIFFWFVSMSLNRASSLIGSLITYVRRQLLGSSRDLLDCFCLPFQQLPGWFKLPWQLQSANLRLLPGVKKAFVFCFLMIEWSVVDTHHSAVHVGLHTSTDL